MLEVSGIEKSYEGQPLLKGVSLTVAAGETVCLLGASGSGKSTLLRIIAGLEMPERGSVSWEGEDLATVPAYRRAFGLVFQDYALFPHLDVFENVAFGLRMQNLPGEAIGIRVASTLKQVNLVGFEKRSVVDLSGGEQQRVALARALAIRPRLLMFDEPLGALDRNLRELLMEELRGILHASGVPAIYVTHDQEEAFSLSDRILLLHEGEIVRSGTPLEVWKDPGSAWAARFLDLGTVLEGQARSDGSIETTFGVLPVACGRSHAAGQIVQILVRRVEDEEFRPFEKMPVKTCSGYLSGKVTDVVFHQERFTVTLSGQVSFYHSEAPRIGDEICVRLPASAIQCLS